MEPSPSNSSNSATLNSLTYEPEPLSNVIRYHSFRKGQKMLDEKNNSRGKEFKKSKRFDPVKSKFRKNLKPKLNRKVIK